MVRENCQHLFDHFTRLQYYCCNFTEAWELCNFLTEPLFNVSQTNTEVLHRIRYFTLLISETAPLQQKKKQQYILSQFIFMYFQLQQNWSKKLFKCAVAVSWLTQKRTRLHQSASDTFRCKLIKTREVHTACLCRTPCVSTLRALIYEVVLGSNGIWHFLCRQNSKYGLNTSPLAYSNGVSHWVAFS